MVGRHCYFDRFYFYFLEEGDGFMLWLCFERLGVIALYISWHLFLCLSYYFKPLLLLPQHVILRTSDVCSTVSKLFVMAVVRYGAGLSKTALFWPFRHAVLHCNHQVIHVWTRKISRCLSRFVISTQFRRCSSTSASGDSLFKHTSRRWMSVKSRSILVFHPPHS